MVMEPVKYQEWSQVTFVKRETGHQLSLWVKQNILFIRNYKQDF